MLRPRQKRTVAGHGPHVQLASLRQQLRLPELPPVAYILTLDQTRPFPGFR